MKNLFLTALVCFSVIFAWSQPKKPSSSKKIKPAVNIKKIEGADKEFCFIPEGVLKYLAGYKDTASLSIPYFFMSPVEITNASYKLFLDDLKAQGRDADYQKAMVQQDKWKTLFLPHGDTHSLFAEYYFDYPAYKHYPVVNVSHEGAELYCQWLTSKLKDTVWEYRLPTKAEWVYAAQGGRILYDYSCGLYLRNYTGQFICNYLRIGDECIQKTESGYEVVVKSFSFGIPLDAFITAPSLSYYPNDYGLYNMSGNVAEMIDKKGVAMGGSWLSPGYDVRIRSEATYDEPNPTLGFRVVLARKKQ